ncbi:restriction endonuclease subunit S [Providencia rettgeri]
MTKPKLRFKQFATKWISSQLSDVEIKVIDGDRGSNYPSKSDFKPQGYCLFLNAGNVTKEGFSFQNVVFISKQKDSILRKGKLDRYDLIMTTRGSVGNIAFYSSKISFENIRINSGMVILRSKGSILPEYFYYYLKSYKFTSWLSKVTFGSAQPQLTVKLINSFPLFYTEKEEQQKIAAFLSSIDAKITLQTRKVELLQQYKKGMMQKLFSQKIRFKDDDGNNFPKWTRQSISDVAEVNPKSKALPDDFIYIDLESVQSGRIVQFKKTSKINAPSRAQRLLKFDDVLFQLVRPYQKNNLHFREQQVCVASTGYAQLRAKCNAAFLFQLLHLDDFTDQVMNRCTGTSYPAINSSDLASIQCEIPCLEEQRKIANFLVSIDDKIILENTKLDKLKQWKQGLLQQMFV